MDSNPTLSEISHLFLSEVRERQTGGAARPTRVGPKARQNVSIDMTPEEFAAATGAQLHADSRDCSEPRQVTAVLSAHLAHNPSDRVRQYARHLAAEVGRVGLIEVDGCEFGLTYFDNSGSEAQPPIVIEGLDGRRMAESLEEMSFDVDRWLLSLPNPRTAEAHALLSETPHWVILCTTDHEGVIASYRTLKGLAELGHPRLSVVTLDARDEAEAMGVFRKLDGVSRQFLGCPLEAEPAVRPVSGVTEQVALHCRETHDKAQLAAAPQWRVVADFLVSAIAPVPRTTSAPIGAEVRSITEKPVDSTEPIMDEAAATIANSMDDSLKMSSVSTTQRRPASPIAAQAAEATEVIELPGNDSTDAAILSAVMRQGNELIACPINPPMCPTATLAIGRDRRVMMLAVAGRGLAELRGIGLAYRWLIENRGLIQMALPQFAIDAHLMPGVRLLVDHADLSADVLQPLLQSSAVTVQAYRKLKWGPRTGLLLEAA